MKTLSIALYGAAALLVGTAPATLVHAQSADVNGVNTDAVVTPHGDWTLKDRESWLQSRLDKARDDDSISADEYSRVHAEIDHIKSDEDAMRDQHDGNQLTDNETSSLEARLDSVSDQIHWLRDDDFRRPW